MVTALPPATHCALLPLAAAGPPRLQEPFLLSRSASRSKSSLSLSVGGLDLTKQEQRLTEAELEGRFSASLLPKTLVFTQEGLLALLQVCSRWPACCNRVPLWRDRVAMAAVRGHACT